MTQQPQKITAEIRGNSVLLSIDDTGTVIIPRALDMADGCVNPGIVAEGAMLVLASVVGCVERDRQRERACAVADECI